MKGWRIGWAWVALLCIPILLTAANNPGLLQDTDTRVMIERMTERNDPLSWWTGDWPLLNHFYRPMVTMVFELDQMIHPWSPAGFGFTNALLCAGCMVALFWMLRELTDEMPVALGGATLFALWTAFPTAGEALSSLALILAAAGLLGGLIRRNWGLAALALLVGLAIAPEVGGIERVRGGVMDWIPGRTATTMSLFGFMAIAAYARYERLTAARRFAEPSPFDVPATRSTVVEESPKRVVGLWMVASYACTALALASYEQAVMLPALYIGIAVTFTLLGRKPRWGWAIASWLLLFAYLGIRRTVLPSGTSEYQDQQFRNSLDVFMTLADYAFPAARTIYALAHQLDLGLFNVLMTQQKQLWGALAYAVAYPALAFSARFRWLSRQEFAWLLSGFAMSFFAFMPMAWLKPFQAYNHYHYFSMGFRSLFAVVGIIALVRIAVIAASPRGRQAPPRLAPAPGSLPRP